MSWALYAFGAAFFWSINIILDKYVVDHEIDDPGLTTIFCSLSAFTVIGLAALTQGGNLSKLQPVHFILGGLYTVALMAYYSGIGREDVSRFAPTLATDTIFILILSSIFIGETFTAPVYAGIFAVVLGAFLISLDDPVHSLKTFQSKKGVYLALAAAFVFGTRDVLFKIALSGSSYWTALLGMSVGGLASIGLLAAWKQEKFAENSNKGFEHLLGIGVLMALGYISFIAAINTGPVSLASAIVKSQNLIIFASAVLLSRFKPEIVDEELEKSALIQKLLATGLIIAGLLLIQFY